MSNNMYDKLKFTATIGLPALATLWSAVGIIWGIPYTEPIVATLVALNTFIGALIGVSSKQYKKAMDEAKG